MRRRLMIIILFQEQQETSKEMAKSSTGAVGLEAERLPLMHIKLARNIKKESLHRMLETIFSYGSPVFSEILLAKCLWNLEHSGPRLPQTEKTNGVKVPCSMFIMRALYCRFFSFSCFSNIFMGSICF